MIRFRVVLCLTLLVSSLGFAQTDEEWSPYIPSEPKPSVPPPLVPADPPVAPSVPDEQDEADEPEASTPRGEIIPRESVPGATTGGRAVRLVAAPFGGVIGSFGGAMAGAIVSSFVLLPFCLDALRNPEANTGCIVGFAAFGALGATAGSTACVYWIGRALGGQGRLLPTILGSLVGVTMGAVSGTVSSDELVLILGLGIGPIIGAIVGYEISHSVEESSTEPTSRRRPGFEVLPVVSATPRGGLMGGLVGRF
jgi:hypothetical protein